MRTCPLMPIGSNEAGIVSLSQTENLEHLLVASYSVHAVVPPGVPNISFEGRSQHKHSPSPPHTEHTHRKTNALYNPSKVMLLNLAGNTLKLLFRTKQNPKTSLLLATTFQPIQHQIL